MAVPMICGGVYEYTDPAGNVKQGVLVSVQQSPGDKARGTFLFSGFAPETLSEDALKVQRMKLIGRPASPKIGRPKKE